MGGENTVASWVRLPLALLKKKEEEGVDISVSPTPLQRARFCLGLGCVGQCTLLREWRRARGNGDDLVCSCSCAHDC